ncbi:MAG: peptidylprolyl isomerase [Planctomycetes bacterium]|nr:peptidylprolyl isomerase [Planctomycetota bacterium]
MLNKWLVRAAGAIVISCVAASAGFIAGQGEPKPTPPPRTLKVNQIARVGSRIITAEDLIARIFDSEQAMVPERRNLEPALDYLVYVQLLEAEAERIGCEIKPSEIDSIVTSQIDQTKKGVKEKYGGALSWEDWLKENNMTEATFKRYLEVRTRVVLLKRLVVNYHFDFEDSLECSHILVEKEKTAGDIHNELKAGAKFEDLAVKHSIDPGSAQKGGRLPRYYRGDGMEKQVEDTLWALSDEAYSKPVQSRYGWHIVKRHKLVPGNKAKFFDRRGELLARPDIADDDVAGKSFGFHRWVRCVLARGDYKTERRLPGLDCEANQ